jgi:hypothetical protein
MKKVTATAGNEKKVTPGFELFLKTSTGKLLILAELEGITTSSSGMDGAPQRILF